MAAELSDLLQAANVKPPFVVVGHSYGGIIAREFLDLRPNDVCGMVLVDTNTEHSGQIPYDEMDIMMNGVSYYAVCGYEANHKLTEEEWQEMKDEAVRDGDTAGAEGTLADSGYAKLGEKKQYDAQALGSKPLSVIKGQTERDLRKLYYAGIAEGNGTPEQRGVLLKFLEGADELERKNQREQLRLSSHNQFRECESGHNVRPFPEKTVFIPDPSLILDSINAARDNRCRDSMGFVCMIVDYNHKSSLQRYAS